MEAGIVCYFLFICFFQLQRKFHELMALFYACMNYNTSVCALCRKSFRSELRGQVDEWVSVYMSLDVQTTTKTKSLKITEEMRQEWSHLMTYIFREHNWGRGRVSTIQSFMLERDSIILTYHHPREEGYRGYRMGTPCWPHVNLTEGCRNGLWRIFLYG